jgi:hypothetical protein
MRKVGLLTICCMTLALTAAPAGAATRAEYVAAADAICASYNHEGKVVSRAFKNRFAKTTRKIRNRGWNEEQATPVLFRSFAWLLGRTNKIYGPMTAELFALDVPAGDELAISNWIEGRWAYKILSQIGVRKIKNDKWKPGFGLILISVFVLLDAESYVEGFGFKNCVADVEASTARSVTRFGEANGIAPTTEQEAEAVVERLAREGG